MVTRLPLHRRGVLLVDVLVAVVILGVALSVLVGLTSRALRSQREGEQLAVAAMLLDEQLNLVLARGADEYESRFGEMQGRCEEPFQEYRYQIEISGGQSGDPYDVRATIFWIDSGREKSASIDTKIAPRLGDDPDPDRKPQETITRP